LRVARRPRRRRRAARATAGVEGAHGEPGVGTGCVDRSVPEALQPDRSLRAVLGGGDAGDGEGFGRVAFDYRGDEVAEAVHRAGTVGADCGAGALVRALEVGVRAWGVRGGAAFGMDAPVRTEPPSAVTSSSGPAGEL